jgi:hypothetical protein
VRQSEGRRGAHVPQGAPAHVFLEQRRLGRFNRHLSFPFLVSWDLDFCPTPKGWTTTRAVGGPFFQAPIMNGWGFLSPDKRDCLLIPSQLAQCSQ